MELIKNLKSAIAEHKQLCKDVRDEAAGKAATAFASFAHVVDLRHVRNPK